jgi:hypothetical protein
MTRTTCTPPCASAYNAPVKKRGPRGWWNISTGLASNLKRRLHGFE